MSSLETLNLWLNQQRLAAGLNVGLNTSGSVILVYLGESSRALMTLLPGIGLVENGLIDLFTLIRS